MRGFDHSKRRQSSPSAPPPEATQRRKVGTPDTRCVLTLGAEPKIVFLKDRDDVRLQGRNGNERPDPSLALFQGLVLRGIQQEFAELVKTVAHVHEPRARQFGFKFEDAPPSERPVEAIGLQEFAEVSEAAASLLVGCFPID